MSQLKLTRRSYLFHCILTAVMKGAKPFVPRHIYRTIIAVKVSVMKFIDLNLPGKVIDLATRYHFLNDLVSLVV